MNSTSQSSFVGHTIGPYRVEGELARGGMGIILKARDPLLGRPVAIKLLGPNVFGQTEARRRFLQEARALARLDHPNIVSIYAVGRHEGSIYIATQFVEGENLLQYLERRSALPLDEAFDIGRQLLAALAAIHSLGLVHRDVKTENAMRIEDGRVKLLDFGIVKDLRHDPHITRAKLTLGTPHYSAPEQVRGEAVDGRTDIYSVGVVLFELLTGAIPFDGEHTTEIYQACLRGELPPPSRRRPGLAPAVDAILARFLAREPRKRFRTAADASRALERYLERSGSSTGAGSGTARRRQGVASRFTASLLRLLGRGRGA
jgi:serine/threonine-protein kinase